MSKTVLFSVAGLFVLYSLSVASGAPKGPACPKVTLKFGRTRYTQKGRFVRFVCNTGYIIAGQKYSMCHNGAWDSPLPKCARATCAKANPPIHGLIYPSHRGAVMNFFCKPGFELHGPNATYCDGRTWDNNVPACLPTKTKPPLSCNFESDHLCGWNQDIRHDFDWTRINFKTPSGHLGTGPSFDHTKGYNKDGFYMYIESSSRNVNDTARLISPLFPKMNVSDVCFEFYYHMHGVSTGQLRVYLKKESESWDLDPSKAFFWKSGNYGDRWIHSIHQIGPIDEDFQIVIEGVRGSSYFSDIAIDDVQIIPNCTQGYYETTESDILFTDTYDYQSCVNRCDEDNYVVPPRDSLLMKCDCSDTCTDNNTCCPDYIAVCVLGVTDDFTTTKDYSADSMHNTLSISYSYPTTYKNDLKIKTELSNIDKSITTKYSLLNMANTSTSLPVTSTTIFEQHTNTTLKPYMTTWKSQTLPFLVPFTTKPFVQKKKTTLSANPTTPLTTSAIPITIARPAPKAATTVTDEVTLPEVNEDDKTFFPLPTTTEHLENSSPSLYIKVPDDKNVTSINTNAATIVNINTTNHTKLLIIFIVVSIVFILLIISSVFFVKKYKRLNCINGQRMYGKNSDSQSDVRFLTSDEVLDFNLAYTED